MIYYEEFYYCLVYKWIYNMSDNYILGLGSN